jgi:hypothetical protein
MISNKTKDDVIVECIAEVLSFFKGDVAKTCLWFKTKNPLLGNIKPERMVYMNRHEKLLKFIKNCKEGNIA